MRECARPGCTRKTNDRYQTCSGVCKAFLNEWTDAANLASALGPTPATDELLAGVRKLMSSYDELMGVRRQIREAAREVGIDSAGWKAILDGHHGAK